MNNYRTSFCGLTNTIKSAAFFGLSEYVGFLSLIPFYNANNHKILRETYIGCRGVRVPVPPGSVLKKREPIATHYGFLGSQNGNSQWVSGSSERERA